MEADNARFVGITDLFAERAKSAADAFGGRVFETADEMLADPEIDAGSIGRLLGVHARYSVWWNPDVPEDTGSDDEMFSLTTSRQMA